MPPAHPDWYTDSLFRIRATHGHWQDGMVEAVREADWALQTYRLTWLPADVQAQIDAQLPVVCGPIRLRREDPRWDALRADCELMRQTIGSAW